MIRSLWLMLPALAACSYGLSEREPEATTLSTEFVRSQGGLGLPFESERSLDRDVRIATAAVALDSKAAAAAEAVPPERPHQAERLVIYNGSLAIQVPEPEKIEKEVLALAKAAGGWVQKMEGPRLTLRVPSSKFDDLFARVAALGQVLDRKVTGSDVTDQFRDLKLRLANAEKLLARLQAILEQAKNVQDALAVEKELARVAEEVERLKGAIALMQDQISFSTLSVDLRRSMPTRPTAASLPFPWVRQLGLGGLFTFER